MSNSSQKPRQAPTIPALHNAAYLASLAGTKSLTPASKYVRPYDLAKFIADALMEIEDPASATLVLRNQHARVTRTHNGVLAGKITRGEMVAFDDCRAETRACGLGTVINRADAVAYAAMIGIAFGVGGDREQVAAATAPVVAETTEQRRARWLDWYGKGEHGAVARVYKRELLTNPKADRSFIGKEIGKAKEEKETTKRGGSMFSQLVQDGKRKD